MSPDPQPGGNARRHSGHQVGPPGTDGFCLDGTSRCALDVPNSTKTLQSRPVAQDCNRGPHFGFVRLARDGESPRCHSPGTVAGVSKDRARRTKSRLGAEAGRLTTRTPVSSTGTEAPTDSGRTG